MNGIFSAIGEKLKGDEGRARLYGLGLIAGDLAQGRSPDAGPALQLLDERRSRNQLRQQMQGGEFMDMFSPQEQAFLATLPPQAAQQLIAQRIFERPAPTPPVEINGQLVDPSTGAVIGDYRTAETNEGFRVLTPEEVAQVPGLNPAVTYQVGPDNKITPVDGSGVETGYIATGDAAEALGLDPTKSFNVRSGPNGMQATQIGGSGQVIQIGSEVGTIPQGYELFTDPETGGRSLRPIPGGPADNSEKEQMSEENQQDTANLMVEEIGRARGLIENHPRLTTGVLGTALTSWAGSKSADLSKLLDTIGANISFEYLNAMRQASPTGGALGQVSERELALLTATAGSLSQSQSADQLLFNLERLERQFNTIIHGPQAGATRLRFDPETGEFK